MTVPLYPHTSYYASALLGSGQILLPKGVRTQGTILSQQQPLENPALAPYEAAFRTSIIII